MNPAIALVAAILADLGEITSGHLKNSGNTAAIRLSGTTALPATDFIDFTATGTSPFLKHANFELRADGRARIKSRVLATTSVGTGTNTTEVTLHTLTIPASYEGINGLLHITGHANIGGTNDNKTLRVKVGGTAIATRLYSAAFVGPVRFDLYMFNVGVENGQATMVAIHEEGNGGLGGPFLATTATNINTAVSHDVTVTGQTNNANDDVTAELTVVDILPKD